MIRTSRVGRFINQNLFNVITIAIVITFVIIIVQIMNNIEKNKQANIKIEDSNSTVVEQIYTPQDTVISGDTVDNTNSEINNEIIDNFIELCNSGNPETAYNLLSNECKDIYFPTLDYFINNYYSPIFSTQKTYSIQSWINSGNKYTYKVKILEDMLATGVYNNSNVVEDYYTVVKNEDKVELNINGYIGRQDINFVKEEQGINIEVKYKDMYQDYEEYSFYIKNNSQNIVALDGKENTGSIYLLGTNNTVYSSYIHEIDIQTLVIKPGEEKEIKLKFNKLYNPERTTKGVVFSNILLNYDEYVQTENKSDYINRAKIELYQ